MTFTELYKLQESKANNLKSKNYAPLLSDDVRNEVIKFYQIHNNFKDKLDWNNHKNFKDEDFDFINEYTSNTLQKKDKVSNSKSGDARLIFKDIPEENIFFRIYKETEDWLFVAPLTWEAAKFMDSSQYCGNAGAKWCIGWKNSDEYWKKYVHDDKDYFVLVFNKHYKDLTDKLNDYDLEDADGNLCTEKEVYTKFMLRIPNDLSEIEVWIQPDSQAYHEYEDYLNEECYGINFGVSEEEILGWDYTDFIKYSLPYKEWWEDIEKGIVTIPEGITKINDRAFYKCSELKVINLPSTLKEIGIRAFFGTSIEEVNITNGVTEISDNAFSGCPNLRKISFPDSIKTLGKQSFSGCWRLEEINLPRNLESIGDECFMYISDLKKITIPSSVKLIGESAFKGCVALKELVIENGVEEIERLAFSGCRNLENVSLPESIKEFGYLAFNGCSNLKELYIPSGEINYMAFSDCEKLVNLHISKNAKIKTEAFTSCYSLENVYLEDGTSFLGENAFYRCDSLRNVIIPDSLIEIEKYAFPKTCRVVYKSGKVYQEPVVEKTLEESFNKIFKKFN